VSPVFAEYQFVLADLLDSVRLGLTALPNVASGSAGAIITSGTGTAQLSVSSGAVTVGTINSGAATTVENAVWDATMSSHTGSTTYGGRVIRAANSNVEAFITGAHHIAADIHELQPAVIDNTHFAAGAIDSNAFALSAAEEVADTILGRNIAGGSSSGRNVTQALRFLRNKFTVVGTSLTVYAEDDTTVSWTSTVSTNAFAEPVTGSDPS